LNAISGKSKIVYSATHPESFYMRKPVSDIYHKGNREFQDQFDSRKLADRVNDIIVHDHITDEERTFIESRDMFFISTDDDQGRPTVSYKGGEPGFIRVIDEKTIAFPGYDGNGMFLTVGNIAANHEVGLLLIDFENPQRLRLHETADAHVGGGSSPSSAEALVMSVERGG
jgi:uncharacterized protein